MELEQLGVVQMFIQIEPTSDIPIYAQLASQLIEAIACGKLVGGDTLPSVRSLAADLGMNMHTVNKAYHELERKEIIRIVPKSGAIVNSISQNGIHGNHLERISKEFKPIIAEAIVLGMEADDINKLVSSIILTIKGE
jgi:GntR family transcriptional regulator